MPMIPPKLWIRAFEGWVAVGLWLLDTVEYTMNQSPYSDLPCELN